MRKIITMLTIVAAGLALGLGCAKERERAPAETAAPRTCELSGELCPGDTGEGKGEGHVCEGEGKSLGREREEKGTGESSAPKG